MITKVLAGTVNDDFIKNRVTLKVYNDDSSMDLYKLYGSGKITAFQNDELEITGELKDELVGCISGLLIS